MSAGIKDQLMSGMAWRGLERAGSSFVQFGVSVILARLLVPEQFGLIAMLMILVQLAGVLVQSELTTALIQRKTLSREAECSVFYYGLAVAALLYLLLFTVSPWVARFYGEEMLIPVLRVLSLRIVLAALGQVHQALLTRAVDFRKLLVVGWGSMLAGALTGIVMACFGFGVWALVGQQLASAAAGTLILWVLCSWRPARCFSFRELSGLFGYGSKLLASQLLNTVFDNLYMVTIGKLFSPAALGFYHRGSHLPSMLSSTVNDTVATVLFPSYASMQDDRELMRRTARRSLNALFFVLTPLLVGLCVTAEPVVRILLTDKWLPCVPYLRVMSLSCAFMPFHIINLQVVRAVGRSDIFLGMEIVKMGIDLALILVLYRYGLLALVLGQLLMAICSMIINSFYSRRFIGYSTGQQLKDTAPVMVLSALMAAVVWGAGMRAWPAEWIRLMVQVVCGMAVYLGVAYVCGMDSFFHTWRLLRDYLLRKRSPGAAGAGGSNEG